ncbi:MAG: 3-oxoadipate enol-lactonase [Candidatus Dormibacteria bacterium]
MVAGVSELYAVAGDGCRLAVSVRGEGPPLLLIPGLGSSRRVYAPIVALLSARVRTIVYDPRGIGESDVTDGPYTMTQLASDAVRVLDAVDVQRAAVFGASMGGMVATHVALDHPERVERLIVAAAGPGGADEARADEAATRALLGKGGRTPAEAYRIACTVLYSKRYQQEHPEMIQSEVAQRAAHPVRARAFTAQFEAVRGHDVGARLAALSMPTLVMHGRLDAVNPVRNGEAIAGAVPGARLEVLEEAGHLFFHEEPVRSAQLIADFVCG